jgi:hypothetical protein
LQENRPKVEGNFFFIKKIFKRENLSLGQENGDQQFWKKKKKKKSFMQPMRGLSMHSGFFSFWVCGGRSFFLSF